MAIIKCPECNASVSDRAPICPTCGAEIKGKITVCPTCNTAYFTEKEECPKCASEKNTAEIASVKETFSIGTSTQNLEVVPTTELKKPTPAQNNKPKKNIILSSFIIALIACTTLFYVYSNAQKKNEKEAYALAMKSKEIGILEDYLNNYSKYAPQDHIDSINAHLTILRSTDEKWTNALILNSKEGFEDYLSTSENPKHKKEALQKIDSLDFVTVSQKNTIEAYNTYISDHFDGNYINEANEKIRILKTKEVQQDEYQMVAGTIKTFFRGISERNENKVQETISPNISSFLNKTDFRNSDIALFISKLYKDNVETIYWNIDNNLKIKKKEIGLEEYEYTTVFNVSQDIKLKEGQSETNKYRVQTRIDPTGKIVEFNMIKLLE
ncbi:MAG: zinc ribbon domain-containing protein [Prevotella sp.]